MTLHDGRHFRGKIVGIDPDTDLAAIKIKSDDLPKPLELSERTIQQGELAFSIGHPFKFALLFGMASY